MKTFLMLCILAVPSFCFAQESSKADISINLNGLLPSHSEKNGLGQKASDSAGVLMSFRYAPARFAAFEFNYAHARDTQYFTNASVQSAVHTGVHEVTGAYVLNIPLHNTRFQPFTLAGAGIMQFNPISSGTSVSGPSRKPSLPSCGAQGLTTTFPDTSHCVCSTAACSMPDLTSRLHL